MPTAFSDPYTDPTITQQGPYEQTSQAIDVTNPRDLGADRSYTVDRVDVNALDLSAQDQPPKSPTGTVNNQVGFDYYANGGGLLPYLANSTT